MSFLKPLAMLLASVAMTAAASAAPEIGNPAPDFSATDSNGKAVRLSDYRGKTVVLEWTNDGCPYVQKHYSTNNIQSLQKDAAAKGVVWLSVISSAPGEQGAVSGADANKLSEKRGAAPAAVLLDPEGKVGRAYDARTTPHMFIVNGDGTLVYMGGIDDKPTATPSDVKGAKNYVRAALDDLAAGKPVATPVTRPYGCSVKYKHGS
ncbi:thioredoxin family protein [Rhodomicrobium vannielii ATCC 17100]|uniref:thioredoxin family protein n=1 Tax=Rhodomicrobium vannielii TaxID=1069 RepID=UPI001918A989|nr:thioredoxin family protein [Rhodomicrobium vannielii]MBJ7535634.1 thioredoxin family protein [Rhodomicrobium vannielii ATCC 17100]